jgi:hypothetical protein
MLSHTILQGLIVAGITAAATGYISSKVLDAKLHDLSKRVERIEQYLNGLLHRFSEGKDKEENGQ